MKLCFTTLEVTVMINGSKIHQIEARLALIYCSKGL